MNKTTLVEKGNPAKILEWFKSHRDDEYASILERVVEDAREKMTLR